MTYRVTHTTIYDYEEVVSICHNEIRMTPRDGARQRTHRTGLTVDPAPAVLVPDVDYFGNPFRFLILQEPHRQLAVTASSDVELSADTDEPPVDTLSWETVRDGLRGDRSAAGLAAMQFVFASPHVALAPELVHYALPSFQHGRPLFAAVRDLIHRIYDEFAYDPKATTVATPVAEVLAQRRGVCQDFAHLGIACLRALGLPARYVSGYVRTQPPPGQDRLVGADASHAWLAVWLPESGWIDLDPTNDVVPAGDHVTLAWGRDFGDVSPLRGVVLGGGEHTVRVSVDVVPLEGGDRLGAG